MILRKTLMLLSLMHSAFVAANAIDGRIIDKTTAKPAAGDEVILLDRAAGNVEVGRTRSDASGRFHFRVSQPEVPRSVRVLHAGVAYESAVAEKGSTEIGVYDVTQATADIQSSLQAIRIEPSGDELEVTEMFSFSNRSSPARVVRRTTLFSLSLPPGAKMDSSMAEYQGDSVVKSIAVLARDGMRCSFSFPLKPGVTKIQVQYRLEHAKSVMLQPEIPFTTEMFGIMLPPSAHFEPLIPGSYETQSDERGGTVEMIRHAAAGMAPQFTISLEGAPQFKTVPPVAEKGASNSPSLHSSRNRWVLVMTIPVCFLGIGYLFLRLRRLSRTRLRETIREQLFELESRRVQNQISRSKYDSARSSLQKELVSLMDGNGQRHR